MRLETPRRSRAATVALAASFVACGVSSRTPVDAHDMEMQCRARCEHEIRCGLSTPRDCAEDCQGRFGASATKPPFEGGRARMTYRADYVHAVTRCIEDAGCEHADAVVRCMAREAERLTASPAAEDFCVRYRARTTECGRPDSVIAKSCERYDILADPVLESIVTECIPAPCEALDECVSRKQSSSREVSAP